MERQREREGIGWRDRGRGRGEDGETEGEGGDRMERQTDQGRRQRGGGLGGLSSPQMFV